MPNASPGYTKNYIRRALREIIDPQPNKKEISSIWDFFDSKCAYCGTKLDKGKKQAHIDHLVSASSGGTNHVSNRVLSCATCNEKEKRDLDWKEFLRKKTTNKSEFQSRENKIIKWQKQNYFQNSLVDKNILNKIKRMADEVEKLFESKVDKVRKIKQKNKKI